MANDRAIPLDLLEAGDPAFVDAIREVHDADALAEFALMWFKDRRPSSRELLFEYLDRPLNAFRHEGLIKRLFKIAEAEGDDPLMARFLVLFDRSIRRVRRTRKRWKSELYATESEARVAARTWEGQGFQTEFHFYPSLEKHAAFGSMSYEVLSPPRQSTMPRGRAIQIQRWLAVGTYRLFDWVLRLRLDPTRDYEADEILRQPSLLKKLETLRLFSLATRNYLRRRAWRYFRKMGKTHPERYLATASEALALYRDDDMAEGLALIDNWGLVHILFHHCPALEARPSGWTTRPGRSLAELAPAPMFEQSWEGAPWAVVGLLNARSTTVRRWAIRRVEADIPRHRSALSLEGWLELLGHDDPAVVALAAGVLDGFEGLEALGVDRWLALAESTDPSALEALCALIARHVGPGQVTLERAVRLTVLRPLPVAKLGFSWLKAKAIGPGDSRTVLALVEAECRPLRSEMIGWLRGVLASSSGFEPAMVLEFLDSRHADARLEGWDWFRSDPRVRDDVETWRKLLESPHDDIRLALVAELEARAGGGRAKLGRTLDPDALRTLWAGVLLNVHRGNRAKPEVVRQLIGRLEANPEEAPMLLPLLGVALRSVRGPERRSGLVAVVQLVENRAEVAPLVRSSFPELQFT